MENNGELTCHSNTCFLEAGNLGKFEAPGLEGREGLGSCAGATKLVNLFRRRSIDRAAVQQWRGIDILRIHEHGQSFDGGKDHGLLPRRQLNKAICERQMKQIGRIGQQRPARRSRSQKKLALVVRVALALHQTERDKPIDNRRDRRLTELERLRNDTRRRLLARVDLAQDEPLRCVRDRSRLPIGELPISVARNTLRRARSVSEAISDFMCFFLAPRPRQSKSSLASPQILHFSFGKRNKLSTCNIGKKPSIIHSHRLSQKAALR